MAALSPLVGECYGGLHPATPQAGYEHISWQECVPRADRVRVRSHTCNCKPIVYELCHAGGLLFVRRLYRSDGVIEHQSEWLRTPEGEELWSRILLGHAR
jgi:hypothetical protein